MSEMIQHAKMYQPFLLPTHEDIKSFLEYGRSDEADIKTHLGLKTVPDDTHDEDNIFMSTPSPPRYRDLVEILHR